LVGGSGASPPAGAWNLVVRVLIRHQEPRSPSIASGCADIECFIFAKLRLPCLGIPTRRLASQVSEKDEENNEHGHEDEGLHNQRAKLFCSTAFARARRRGGFTNGGRAESCPATPAPKSAPSAPCPEHISPFSPLRRADFGATAFWTDHERGQRESQWK